MPDLDFDKRVDISLSTQGAASTDSGHQTATQNVYISAGTSAATVTVTIPGTAIGSVSANGILL